MSNVAVVLGNAQYQSLKRLACCEADVEAMKALLEATGKYEKITAVVDADADRMKEAVRETVSDDSPIDEVFFYFSGHGTQIESEFYFCGTGFDSTRPNETGLSTTDLHVLLRAVNPKLVVKVVDACNSGTSLIKADEAFGRVTKGGLEGFIQIASCLDSQFSLTGDPLSRFTQSFCTAALRKPEGAVFYTDLVSSLRDNYLADTYQTPHFVSQGSGREIFVEDARRLTKFREQFDGKWREAVEPEEDVGDEQSAEDHHASMLRLMADADAKFATPESAKGFIDALFDGIIERVKSSEFTDFFDVSIEEHSAYREDTAKPFIVRCLARERRPDEFVTAYVGQKKKRRPMWESPLAAAIYGEEFAEFTTLELNCSLPRVQMKVLFRPKYKSLDQFSLIVTCAPSLNSCYIFERIAKHLRSDWSSFSEDGGKIVEQWYDRAWSEDISWLAEAACDRLLDAVDKHVELTTKRIADREGGDD